MKIILILLLMTGYCLASENGRNLMLYEVTYRYRIEIYGPYEDKVIIEAKNLCNLEEVFERYNKEKHTPKPMERKGESPLTFMPSGEIINIKVLGYPYSETK